MRTLRSFIAVAETGSFSGAARILNTVQPAVSRHISELEDELGVVLFLRNTREVRITPAGESLMGDALEIMEREGQAGERARRAARGETGELRIGYLGSASMAFLPWMVRQFQKRYPGVALSLFEMTAMQQIEAFRSGVIDLGISRPLPEDMRENYMSEVIYQDRLIAVVPDNHSLYAERSSLSLGELTSEPFILFERQEAPGLFDGIINLCRSYGFSPEIRSRPASMQTVLLEVASGLGVSLVPGCIRKLYTRGCAFIPLKEKPMPILAELHYPLRPVPPTAQVFSSMIKASREKIQREYL